MEKLLPVTVNSRVFTSSGFIQPGKTWKILEKPGNEKEPGKNLEKWTKSQKTWKKTWKMGKSILSLSRHQNFFLKNQNFYDVIMQF